MSKKISERNKRLLNADKLREQVNYDYRTGLFTWKPRRYRSAKGQAGCLHSHGYIVIQIGNVQYPAHRLAWLYHYGKWPTLEIDHKDTNRKNNAIDNLREATQRQNNANMRAKPHNKTGFKGVRLKWGRWEASIVVDGKYYYCGTHDTPEQASSAYLAKAIELNGEFARAA